MGATSSTLTREVLRHLVASTQFNVREVRVLHRYFRYGCAVNSKGKQRLGRNEFMLLFGDMFPDADSIQFSEHAFRIYDMDNNGKIDFQEFVMVIDNLVKGSQNDKMDTLFKLYDIDGTKKIAKREACDIIEDLKRLNSGFVPKENVVDSCMLTDVIFSKIGDGEYIDQKQFVKVACESEVMRELLEGSTRALYQPLVWDALQAKSPWVICNEILGSQFER